MRRAIALVLVVAVVVFARRVGGEAEGRFATMALGFVLIGAALVGEAFERIHLPRLTGYLLVGVAFGPAAVDLITPAAADQLRLVNGLAVALIAFGAGIELDLPSLRDGWRSLLRHGLWLVGIVFAGLLILSFAAAPHLPFTAGLPWTTQLAAALLVASVMTTFSPTVTMAVLAETQAEGPLASRVLSLVVLADLAVVLLFTLATSAARLLAGSTLSVLSVAGHLVWEIAGSLAVGAAAGAAIYLYRRLIDRKSGLLVAGVCIVLAEVGARIGLSPLLACLAAGMVVRNAAPDDAHAMDELLARVRLPVLVVFFGAAGASLHLDELAQLWPYAVGLALARGLLTRVANHVGARQAALSEPVAGHVWLGLVSQAGVTFGLAVIVGRDFGAWGRALETLFVATIALHELVGPIAFRWALARLGEIPGKAPALARPPAGEPRRAAD